VFFLLGSKPTDIFNSFTKLTGRPQLPQLFSLGYHQCRWNYNDQDDVENVNQKFDEYDIPYDVLWLDIEHTDQKKYFTWDYSKFPHPEEMQKKLASHGRKMVTIIDPHIKKDSSFDVYSKGIDGNLFVKTHNGDNYEGWCWPGHSHWLDYTNPAAREMWARKFLDYPVSAFLFYLITRDLLLLFIHGTI
jgi:alpha 1,3-glucosidase